MFNRLLLASYLFLSTTTVLIAQDYVVILKGDTLRGSVKLLSYDRLDRVEIKADGKKKVFTALEARSVFYKNELYHTIQLESVGLKYMKLIKGGYLSIYTFRPVNQVTYDGVYLYKRSGQGIEMPNLTFKKGLSDFLDDCITVKTKIKDGVLSKRDINKIVDEYNQCLESLQKANAVPVVEEKPSEKLVALDNLIAKVEANPNFDSKKDALDILKDLRNKSYRNETIPNYLVEGLKANLSSQTALSEELQKVIVLLQK